MKQTTRILALSALVLAVMLAAFGVPALEAPSVAFAQGQVPAAPTGLTAQRSGASTINLSWNSVSGAVRYQLYAYNAVDGWERLDGGADNPLTATTFPHPNLTADRRYVYQVYGVNAAGNRGPRSARVDEVAGQNAPGRPVLTANPGYQLNMITWPALPRATSYVLYAHDGASWSQIGGMLTSPSYTHRGLTVGQTYYYEARGVNASGVRGPYSAQDSATVLSSPTITAPQNLQAGDKPEDQQVTLTWQSPPGAGQTITGYEYRYAESTATLPDTWVMDAGNDLTETVTGLTNGTQYTFEVRAKSSGGVGPAASVMATPAAVPDAPALTATEGYQMVTLSWDAPANNGAAIIRYHIEMLDAQNDWVAVPSSVGGTATSYTIRNLNDSTVYTYRIIAENAAGRSSASNSADATTLAQPAQAPGPPTGIGAESGPGKITLSWQAPLTTGGSPITEYQYRYAAAASTTTTGISWSRWISAMMELEVDVEPLTPGTVYSFEVRAVNSAGAGDAVNSDSLTAAATKTPGATGPTAVPSLRTPEVGMFTGGTVEDHESRATVTLSWAQLPASANGGVEGAVTAYEICYKKSTGSVWMRWTEAGFGTPVLTGSVYSAVHGADAGKLDPGTAYQYRIRGLNSVETAGDADTCKPWDGDWSNVVSATTPVVKPAAPTLLAAIDTNVTPNVDVWDRNVNSITIKWTAPENTGGADITGYEVWVGTETVSDATTITGPTVTNLPPSRTEYISIGLSPNTPYFYRVRARNGAGDSRVGAWSSEQSGTTTQTEAGTPGAPASAPTAAAADNGDVAVSWRPPTDRGTTPITSYEVQYQRTDDDDGTADGAADTADADNWDDAMTGVPTPPTSTSFTHMMAPGLSAFSYRVRAVNGSGPGAWSDPGVETVDARGPDAPMLTATAVGDDEIMLQWTIPGKNGSTITGFDIRQWDPDDGNGGDWGDTSLLTGDMSTNPALTVFIVDDLSAGTKYYYRIRTTGNNAGDWSAENMADAASATTMAGKPGYAGDNGNRRRPATMQTRSR